ncbi:MAG: hypothetical protein WB809_00795 [Thermoplasmata archaeon]
MAYRTPLPPDLRAVGAGPWATFLHGSSREVLHRVAYAFGAATHPSLYWVSICEEGIPPMAEDPIRLGWVTEERHYTLATPDARPQDAVANMALGTVLRSDESESNLAEFTDFIRLPGVIQDAVSRSGVDPPRPVLVVADTDRVRSYYPTDVEGVRHVIDPFRRNQMLCIFTAVGSPGAGRMAFDFVFKVQADSLARWRAGQLIVEKAPVGTSFHTGESYVLAQIPGMEAAFENLPPTSGKS